MWFRNFCGRLFTTFPKYTGKSEIFFRKMSELLVHLERYFPELLVGSRWLLLQRFLPRHWNLLTFPPLSSSSCPLGRRINVTIFFPNRNLETAVFPNVWNRSAQRLCLSGCVINPACLYQIWSLHSKPTQHTIS